jgi:hypothetical protein
MKAKSEITYSFQAAKVLALSIASMSSMQALSAQTPMPPVIVTIDNSPVAPSTAQVVPLSWDDTMFSTAASSGQLNLGSGQTRSNLAITDQSGEPALTCDGSCNLDHIKIRAREGYRCVSGTQNLSWMFIEATGTGSDHADGLQCYNPGGTGSVVVKNSTFKVSGAANAAYFSADNWRGSHVLENVLIWGGQGFFVPGDGGSSISLTNVYFVGPFTGGGPIRTDMVNGLRATIVKWENVRNATIVNGKLVLGTEIPRPY